MQTLPPPRELVRQITEYKWEAGEDILRQYPLKKECIVEVEKGRHIYKVVRDGMRIVRVHIRLRG